MERSIRVLIVAALILIIGHAEGAPTPQESEQRSGIQIFASADESSPVVESIAPGATLSPIAEMTGAGGAKWFMVKTKSGNVGWIKADNSADVRRLDGHFRALPKDSVSIGPTNDTAASLSTAPASATPGRGTITVPVKISGPRVLVPVSFQSGSSTASAYLVLDTGAMQTMISKRMARSLRLLSIDSQMRTGISGSLVADVGVVDLIRVGSANLKNLPVTIHDLPSGSEGLLGFDFLGRFQMSIDSDKQEMVLTPRKQ